MALGDRVPLNLRENVSKVFRYIQSISPTVSQEHMDWLWDVYDKHVHPNNCYKRTCSTQTGMMLKVFKTYVDSWSKQEENL